MLISAKILFINPGVGSRFLAVSLQVTWVINPTAIAFRQACYQFCCLHRPQASCRQFEGWPHHARTFSVLCHSDWLFHGESYPSLDVVHPRLHAPATVPCSLSPDNYIVASWYASFLPLTVSNNSPFTPALLRTHSFVFFAVHETHRIFSVLSSQRRQDVFLHSFESPAFTTVCCYRPH